MGGFFGVSSSRDIIEDVFFGTDYHSHLGTRRGGIATYDKDIGLQKKIHNIENSPFRTKFENIQKDMSGCAAIGCISDTDPQPILIKSRHGMYAICMIGIINNINKLVEKFINSGETHFNVMNRGIVNSNELVATMINMKKDLVDGLSYAQECIEGTASILILTESGEIIAARDKLGRLPICIGKDNDGYCVSFESFAYQKLGYKDVRELGSGEIVMINNNSIKTLKKSKDKMKICAFLWSYYGYPTSCYEGKNVEVMRYKNGEIMADAEIKNGSMTDVDYVAGVPDSGTPHAIGYANRSKIPFARPFVKYTPTWPRSFMPPNQTDRIKIAKMKQIPVKNLIEGQRLLFIDDSIVRGTQLRETVDFLYKNGAKEVHIRSACPPIMYGCKYLNFSRATSDLELIARRTILEIEGEKGFGYLDEYSNNQTKRGRNMRNKICQNLHFSSLEFQSLDGVIKAIGLEPSKICTYCWNGEE